MKRIVIPIFLTITISLSTIAMEHDKKKKKKQTYTREEMLRLSGTKISKKGPPPGANTACLESIRNDSNKPLTSHKTHKRKKRPILNVKNHNEKFNDLKGVSKYILDIIEGNY